MSLRIGNVCDMSAPQGGISRAITLVLIAFAHGRASSYDSSDIGATSPGRWQFAHLLYMIGATSLANVGAACGPVAGRLRGDVERRECGNADDEQRETLHVAPPDFGFLIL